MYSDKAYFLIWITQAEIDDITGSSEANLNAAIKAADSDIDSYLRSRYKDTALPLSPVPESIKDCSYKIAMEKLYRRVSPNNVPDFIVKNHDDAVSYLTKISKGIVNILPEVQEDKTESFIEYGGFETVMTRKG